MDKEFGEEQQTWSGQNVWFWICTYTGKCYPGIKSLKAVNLLSAVETESCENYLLQIIYSDYS